MKKDDIQKIRIDVVSNNQSVLSMLLDSEGKISRQGRSTLPVEPFEVMGENDGSVFSKLIETFDERAFEHAGVYDHPDKSGQEITYSVAFLGNDEDVSVFEFRLGTETKDVGELLPYFDNFISNAVKMTNDWYEAEKAIAEVKQ